MAAASAPKRQITVVDVLDGAPFPQAFSRPWGACNDGGQHKTLTAGSGGITNAWYARGAGVGVPLSLVVSDLCLRPGLTAGEIDVGELTDTVRGNAINRQSSALVDFRQAFTQALESTKNHDRHRSHFPPAPRKIITLKLAPVEVASLIRRLHRVSSDGRHHREIWLAAEGRVDSI